jgi:hypothetical protein
VCNLRFAFGTEEELQINRRENKANLNAEDNKDPLRQIL